MDGAAASAVMLSAMAVMVSCHQICFIGSEYNPQSGIPHRWFLPYKDLCQCTAIRLGGMNISASSYRQGAPYYLEELFLSEVPHEIQAYFDCEHAWKSQECPSPEALGMEDGKIQDERIKASSTYGTSCCLASAARLNSNKRWVPSRQDSNPWIEVDLTHPTVVSGIITQGFQPNDDKGPRYVTNYTVSYRNQPGPDYEQLTDEKGDIMVFNGNSEATTPATRLFDASVLATVVRIQPTACHWWVNLRLELLGCRLG